jgi:hypothetical protein
VEEAEGIHSVAVAADVAVEAEGHHPKEAGIHHRPVAVEAPVVPHRQKIVTTSSI